MKTREIRVKPRGVSGFGVVRVPLPRAIGLAVGREVAEAVSSSHIRTQYTVQVYTRERERVF